MIRGQPIRFGWSPGIGLILMAGSRIAQNRFDNPPLRFHGILTREQRLVPSERIGPSVYTPARTL